MYDGVCPSESPVASAVHQRARGTVRLGFRRRRGSTVLDDLYQEGALKARFPRPRPGTPPIAVLLNTAGGVAGGDALQTYVGAAPGAMATVTTQSAERIYRALPDSAPSSIVSCVAVSDQASIEWLPQETIVFDRANLARRLEAEIAADGTFLCCETIVFGRAAMGEKLERGNIADLIRIRRNGRLLLHDSLRLTGDIAGTLAHPAIANGARGVSTLVLVSPDAEMRLCAFRAACAGTGAAYGASAWDGMLVGRIVHHSLGSHRAAVVAGLAALRDGSLPRIWLT